MSIAPHYIRITAIPPGEAPLWVREKWVGLDLPLADGELNPREAYTSGVLSGPSNRFFAIVWRLLGRLKQRSGYPVNVNEALAILEKTAPDAASWWRENVPRLQHRERKFLFRKSVCEAVDAKPATNETPTKALPDGTVRTQTAASSPLPHIPLPPIAPPARP